MRGQISEVFITTVLPQASGVAIERTPRMTGAFHGAIDSTTPAFGLLVLGSPDPQRFDATMGTEFLARMAELASAALERLR